MSPVTVIITVALYFALLIGVSWLASRKGSVSSFFNGDRRMPWGIVAFAMIGSAISGVTFISVPGMVAAKNYSYLQMALGFVVGYIIIALVLVPLFYRLKLLSIYGYLESRFGRPVYKTGAFFFILSKLLGAGVRFFVVCAVLQILVFDPLGVPFALNVTVTVALIWLYTVRGGVKSLIWTDIIKSFCLIMTVVLSILYVARGLGLDGASMWNEITAHPTAKIFHFEDPGAPVWFWKQFVAGVFLAIAMNGLDQDMMQRHLSCTDSISSRKNMIVSGVMQLFVIGLFLLLGTALNIYVERTGMEMPDKSDELFGMVATSGLMPAALGVMFVVGLISAAYSAAGSALTSLTTSVTVDLLEADKKPESDDKELNRTRRRVHAVMSAAMAGFIILFWHLGNDDAISAVYTLASYTYGPLLGLFAYGIFSRRTPSTSGACAACLAAPILSWVSQWLLSSIGYNTGFELLLMNAAYTVGGLALAASPLFMTTLTATSDGKRPA